MTTRPKFQRRHFQAVADIIARAKRRPNDSAVEALSDIEQDFADAFASDNCNFRRGRFHAACDPLMSQDKARHLGVRRAARFKPAPVTFVNAKGERTELRADLERHLAAVKERGPEHQQPSHHVEVGKPDEPDKAVIAQDEPPQPQTLRDHPRAYEVPKLTPYRPKPPAFSKDERSIGSGREGIGVGPDPSKIGKHVGFRVTQR